MTLQNRLLFAFLICCTGVQIATAQKNFEPGFIVTKNRDTISGFIDNRLWVSAPRSVEFKTTQTAPATFYAPLDINGFFVGDSWYAAKIVAMDKSPHELGNLSNENKPQFDTDTLFLPALVVGRANLYTMEDENRKRHFFLEKDTVAITELIYR